MTRGYIIFTEDGRTAANAVYLDSSAYPSYYGLILLETIQNGEPLNEIGTKPGFPLSELDEVVRAEEGSADTALPKGWCILDYLYIYNTKTKELSVRKFGTLLYTLNLNNQMDVCRALFKHDELIDDAIAINRNTLFQDWGNEAAMMQTLLGVVKNEEDLLEWVRSGPRAYITECFSRVGSLPEENPYQITLLTEGSEGELVFKPSYHVVIAADPELQDWYKILMITPLGQFRIATSTNSRIDSKQAGEKILKSWVLQYTKELIAYRPVFKAVCSAKDEMAELAKNKTLSYEEIGFKARSIISECLGKTRVLLDGIRPVPGLFSVADLEEDLQRDLAEAVWAAVKRSLVN